MSAKDLFHDEVRIALEKEGWVITNDPLTLSYGGRNVFVDLGAEHPLAAEKEGRQIAVEIKSFVGASDIQSLGNAIGKFHIYRNILEEIDPQRELYIAIPSYAYLGIFQEPLGQLMIKRDKLLLIVFDEKKEVISQWIQ
jgi:hypothetical protein